MYTKIIDIILKTLSLTFFQINLITLTNNSVYYLTSFLLKNEYVLYYTNN